MGVSDDDVGSVDPRRVRGGEAAVEHALRLDERWFEDYCEKENAVGRRGGRSKLGEY